MLVARSRGATFRVAGGVYCVAAGHEVTADSALVDVAQALGYVTAMYYNEACLDRPDEVRTRLERL